jgi:hypothetical protein
MNSSRITAMVSGLVVGCLGGAVIWSLGLASSLTGLVLGALYGLLFALLLMRRVAGPGAGLLWGLGLRAPAVAGRPRGAVPAAGPHWRS